MNENGIHVIYPMGRDKGITYPGTFNMYKGFALRVIGYVNNPYITYEHAVGQANAYALMKFNNGHGHSAARPISGNVADKDGSRAYYYGDYYSFAIRGEYGTRKEAYQTFDFEDKLGAMEFPWYGAKHFEYLVKRSCVHLSKHFCDWPPADFPTSTGLRGRDHKGTALEQDAVTQREITAMVAVLLDVVWKPLSTRPALGAVLDELFAYPVLFLVPADITCSNQLRASDRCNLQFHKLLNHIHRTNRWLLVRSP
ncbi:hypothetical protein MTO96_015307 [Rhipicephalus appendiculatus]